MLAETATSSFGSFLFKKRGKEGEEGVETIDLYSVCPVVLVAFSVVLFLFSLFLPLYLSLFIYHVTFAFRRFLPFVS